jgi:GNAT superfamily N-acetyltransferase
VRPLAWLARRASSIHGEEGTRGVLRGVFRYTRWRLSRLAHVRYWYVYRYPITQFDVEQFHPTVEHLEVRVVESPADCARLAAEGYQDPRAKVRSLERRLAAGAVMVSAFVAGKLAYTGWVATTETARRSFDSLPYRADFAGGEAATGGALTMPAYRGLGLYRYVFGHELDYLRRRGRTFCCNSISVDNHASQRGQAVHEALVCARARHVRILCFQWWTEQPLSGPCPFVAGRPGSERRRE